MKTVYPMAHKNKTLAAFLAIILGGVGAHRFYLHGSRDWGGWLHVAMLPVSLLVWLALPEQPWIFTGCALILSVLVAQLEALVIGLTPDERWDATYNASSGKPSNSGWTVILLMIVAMAGGTVGLISLIARAFDLLYTGGAYG